MTAEKAMFEVARAARALSLAEGFLKRNPSQVTEADVAYARRRRAIYEAAYKQYTDPFGTKTYG